MKDKYLRGWRPDKHITAFAVRLKRDKKELAVNGVMVRDDEIQDHYVIKILGGDSGILREDRQQTRRVQE